MLVEAITYRYFGHSKSDRNLYRTKEEIEEWKKSDPIVRFKKMLVDARVLSSKNADELDQKAQSEIDGAVAYAEASPDPDPAQVTEYVYA